MLFLKALSVNIKWLPHLILTDKAYKLDDSDLILKSESSNLYDLSIVNVALFSTSRKLLQYRI